MESQNQHQGTVRRFHKNARDQTRDHYKADAGRSEGETREENRWAVKRRDLLLPTGLNPFQAEGWQLQFPWRRSWGVMCPRICRLQEGMNQGMAHLDGGVSDDVLPATQADFCKVLPCDQVLFGHRFNLSTNL